MAHYGIPRRSGRYPWGSGERPYQSLGSSGKVNKALQKREKKYEKVEKRGKRLDLKDYKDTALPTGTIIWRTDNSENGTASSGSTYVSTTDLDRKFYSSTMIPTMRKRYGMNSDDPFYEHEYEIGKDTKIAGIKTVDDTVKELMKNKEFFIESSIENDKYLTERIFNLPRGVTNIMGDYAQEKITEKELRKKLSDSYDQLKDLHSAMGKEDFIEGGIKRANSMRDVANNLYKDAYETKSTRLADTIPYKIEFMLGRNGNLRDQVIGSLKNQGYEGMYDIASIGFGSPGNIREGIAPMMLFTGTNLVPVSTRKIDEKSEQFQSDDESFKKFYNKVNRGISEAT